MAGTWMRAESGVRVDAHGRYRFTNVDALRGVAILLMVLDHVLAVVMYSLPSPAGLVEVSFWLRMTVTRASLPLFLIVAGNIGHEHQLSRRRTWQLSAAAACVTVVVIGSGLPLGRPDILVLILGVVLVSPAVRRWPVVAIALGVVQSTTWPVEWSGYQPGTVLALYATGVAFGQWEGASGFPELGWMPGCVEAVGRRPLTWYLGHVLVLAVVVVVFA